MAALAATTPTNSGVVIAGAAVAASDTIDRAVMGSKGCYLEIINGNASPDTVTISDNGLTPAGNGLTGSTISVSVTNGTSKVFLIRPDSVNPATNLVTITHTTTATVTYKLYPVGF
jgi:hypothetical protein